VHFGAIVGVANVTLCLVAYLLHRYRVLTVTSLLGVLYVLLGLVFHYVHIPWDKLVKQEHQPGHTGTVTKVHLYALDEIAGAYVTARAHCAQACEDMCKQKQANYVAYAIRALLFYSVTAYVGSLLPGWVIAWLVLNFALVLPGLIANDVFTMLMNKIPPPVRVHVDNVLAKICAFLPKCTACAESGASSTASAATSAAAPSSSSSSSAAPTDSDADRPHTD